MKTFPVKYYAIVSLIAIITLYSNNNPSGLLTNIFNYLTEYGFNYYLILFEMVDLFQSNQIGLVHYLYFF